MTAAAHAGTSPPAVVPTVAEAYKTKLGTMHEGTDVTPQQGCTGDESPTPAGHTVNASPASPFKIAARISRSGMRPRPCPQPVR